MTQIMGNSSQGLTFEIISSRIAEYAEEKKYVLYTIQIRFISGNDDLNPSIIERRYTDFLDLFISLKEEQPQLFSDVSFPKKVLMGNFENELISQRSTWFEWFLRYITNDSRLRNSYALLNFLQDKELKRAKNLLKRRDYPLASPILENNLKLLNKVYMDRSPAVLISLLRLLACNVCTPGMPDSLKWADLAIHRFDGVSDSDLLKLYVPLLRTCIIVWSQNNRNTNELEKRLSNLQRSGVRCDENTFLDIINNVEQNIFGVN